MAINTFFTYIWLVIAVADGKSFGVADPLSGFSYRRDADDYLFVIFDLARLAVQSAGTQVWQRDAVAAVMLSILIGIILGHIFVSGFWVVFDYITGEIVK